MDCARCHAPLKPGEGRRVPRWLAVPATFALAMVHGGLWAQEALARVYCARCRRRLSAWALLGVLVAASAFAAGAFLWLKAARLALGR